MKNLNQFTSEEAKKKSEAKPARKGEKADDQKYIELMMKYKKLRRGDDRDKANKVLEQAQKLGRDGEVSREAKLAAAYL